jgi:hypothetical protein
MLGTGMELVERAASFIGLEKPFPDIGVLDRDFGKKAGEKAFAASAANTTDRA